MLTDKPVKPKHYAQDLLIISYTKFRQINTTLKQTNLQLGHILVVHFGSIFYIIKPCQSSPHLMHFWLPVFVNIKGEISGTENISNTYSPLTASACPNIATNRAELTVDLCAEHDAESASNLRNTQQADIVGSPDPTYDPGARRDGARKPEAIKALSPERSRDSDDFSERRNLYQLTSPGVDSFGRKATAGARPGAARPGAITAPLTSRWRRRSPPSPPGRQTPAANGVVGATGRHTDAERVVVIRAYVDNDTTARTERYRQV